MVNYLCLSKGLTEALSIRSFLGSSRVKDLKYLVNLGRGLVSNLEEYCLQSNAVIKPSILNFLNQTY